MDISGARLVFLFGCAGGACLELLRWWKVRDSVDFPTYAGKPTYWVITIAMILAGGFIAAVHGTGPTTAVLAMNLGASAPAIIGAFATPPREENPGQERTIDGPRQPRPNRVRKFLAFR